MERFDSAAAYLFIFILIILWLIGLVLAKGFWMTLTAIYIFPYAWYLAVEMLMARFL